MSQAVPDDFLRRVAQIQVYSAGWWRRDLTVDDLCRRVPGLRKRLERLQASRGEVTTQDIYAAFRSAPRWPDDWQDARVALDEELLDRLPPLQPLLGRAPSSRQAYVTLGLPGSGKTALLRELAWAHFRTQLSPKDRQRSRNGIPAGAAVVDADEIRVEFAEFAGGFGSTVVQPETALLTYGPRWSRLLAVLPPALLLDTVGSRTELPPIVDLLLDHGYEVHLLLASLDVEEAVGRVIERCLAVGRYVWPDYVRSKAGVPEASLSDVVQSGRSLAGWGVWDTSKDPAEQIAGHGSFAL